MMAEPSPEKTPMPVRVSTVGISRPPATTSNPEPASTTGATPVAVPVARVLSAKAGTGSAPAKPATPSPVRPRTARAARSFGERCERIFLSLPTLWAIGLTSATLVAWVILARLPQTFERRVVSAREALNQTEAEAAQAAHQEGLDPIALSSQVAVAERYLLTGKDEIIPLLTEIGKIAKQCGLLSEVGAALSSERTPVVPRVKVLSTVLRLQPLPTRSPVDGGLYPRMVSLLEKLEQLTNKVEVSGLSAASEKAGSGSAQLELQFWVREPHDKDSGK